ncbi:hypothetical protein MHU86_23584 [Fragilaria crotonensis]|nr:hypothetical protein MHU86_23584 [Fragilaria crotonensis]
MEDISSEHSPILVDPTLNDGTHRITIKWKVDADVKKLAEEPHLLYSEIHSLLGLLFDKSDGELYPWKNSAEYTAQPVLQIPTPTLDQYVTPNITTVEKSSLVIFAIRFGFSHKHPGVWQQKSTTKETIALNNIRVQVSNSTSLCGASVIAGYVLLKHPTMTHKTWYLKHLRQQLPKDTPYFDLRLRHQTPTGQTINHIAVECGVNQVTPVCQALLQVLNGTQTAIFLPRYAFASMTQEKIAAAFEAHNHYVSSLTQLPLFPVVAHLDRPRLEQYPDGTTVERSTREWAMQLCLADGTTPAQCDVVNGGKDRHAYFLVPTAHAAELKIEWRQYKERLNPMSKREATYRERIPDLPTAIYLPPSLQSTLDHLDRMSTADVWRQVPPSVKQPPKVTQSKSDTQRTSTPRSKKRSSLVKRAPTAQPTMTPVPPPCKVPPRANIDVLTLDTDSESDTNEEIIKKSIPTSRTDTNNGSPQVNRMDELETLLRSQHRTWETTSAIANNTAQQLSTIQSRMDQFDKLQDNVTLSPWKAKLT